ncbi:lysozyme-like domain-containing protein [Umbelopsis sp. PMI_123]|nr:lysozyme-like domain-containing protein [Umbelopsis sp. PMI_123]
MSNSTSNDQPTEQSYNKTVVYTPNYPISIPVDDCQKVKMYRLTSTYENSDIYLHFGYCDDLGDGRGYTSGIIGFCTATGDAIQVIQEYNNLVPQPNEFSRYYDTLVNLAKNGDDSTSSISQYCQIWEAVSRDPDNGPLFRQAQMLVADSVDYVPAMSLSNNLGLQYAVSRGQMYDALVQHGNGTDPDSILSLINRTAVYFSQNTGATNVSVSNSGNTGPSGSVITTALGNQVDEITWLRKFLDVRKNDLENPSDNSTAVAWRQSTTRVDSYSYLVNQGDYNWTNSFNMALDNDGNLLNVSCIGGFLASDDTSVPEQLPSESSFNVTLFVEIFVPLMVVLIAAVSFFIWRRYFRKRRWSESKQKASIVEIWQ